VPSENSAGHRDVNKADFAEAFKLLHRFVREQHLQDHEHGQDCGYCGADYEHGADHGEHCLLGDTEKFLARFRA
jgi:hypothetical protein